MLGLCLKTAQPLIIFASDFQIDVLWMTICLVRNPSGKMNTGEK